MKQETKQTLNNIRNICALVVTFGIVSYAVDLGCKAAKQKMGISTEYAPMEGDLRPRAPSR